MKSNEHKNQLECELIFRGRIPNSVINDERLTAHDLGYLRFICTCEPNWTPTEKKVRQVLSMGWRVHREVVTHLHELKLIDRKTMATNELDHKGRAQGQKRYRGGFGPVKQLLLIPKPEQSFYLAERLEIGFPSASAGVLTWIQARSFPIDGDALAKRFKFSISTANRHLKGLVDKGMVTREADGYHAVPPKYAKQNGATGAFQDGATATDQNGATYSKASPLEEAPLYSASFTQCNTPPLTRPATIQAERLKTRLTPWRSSKVLQRVCRYIDEIACGLAPSATDILEWNALLSLHGLPAGNDHLRSQAAVQDIIEIAAVINVLGSSLIERNLTNGEIFGALAADTVTRILRGDTIRSFSIIVAHQIIALNGGNAWHDASALTKLIFEARAAQHENKSAENSTPEVPPSHYEQASVDEPSSFEGTKATSASARDESLSRMGQQGAPLRQTIRFPDDIKRLMPRSKLDRFDHEKIFSREGGEEFRSLFNEFGWPAFKFAITRGPAPGRGPRLTNWQFFREPARKEMERAIASEEMRPAREAKAAAWFQNFLRVKDAARRA